MFGKKVYTLYRIVWRILHTGVAKVFFAVVFLVLVACNPFASSHETASIAPMRETPTTVMYPTRLPSTMVSVSTPWAQTDTMSQTVTSLASKEKIVRMGRAVWDSGWFQAEIFTLLLQKMGYTVQGPTTLDNFAFYLSVARGDMHMWPNGWFPMHTMYTEYRELKNKIEVIGHEVNGASLHGYLIDKKTADALKISTIADLKDPEIAKVFDTNKNGKADLVGCSDRLGCTYIVEHHLEVYGLRDTVEILQGDYITIMTEVMSLHERGIPILFYAWTPNWTFSQLVPGEDVVWLQVPFTSLPPGFESYENTTVMKAIPGCPSDPCNLGWPTSSIRVVANKEFLAAHPDIKHLLELVEIPIEDIEAQNIRMFNGEGHTKDIQHHAQVWVEEHADSVEQWITEAKAVEQQDSSVVEQHPVHVVAR